MLSDAIHVWRHVDLCRDYIGSMDTVPGMENQMEKKMETGTIRFSYWDRNCMQGSGCFEWVLALYQLYMEHTGIKPRAAHELCHHSWMTLLGCFWNQLSVPQVSP